MLECVYIFTLLSERERRRKCRDSVHSRNAAFEAVSAPEQYCSAPLLKVERSESSLNTFVGAEIATDPRIGK